VSWQLREHPAKQPHEYIRGGTTKILTLFHPATGQVRLQPAARGTNAVLHPWLRERLTGLGHRLWKSRCRPAAYADGRGC
jgi:hypothetical protein